MNVCGSARSGGPTHLPSAPTEQDWTSFAEWGWEGQFGLYQPSKPRLHRTWDGRGGGWNTRRHNMHFPFGAFPPSQPTHMPMAYFVFPKVQFYCQRRLRIMKKRVLQRNRASLWLRSSRETISRSRKSWETSAVAGGKRIGKCLPTKGVGLSLAQQRVRGAAPPRL